jgi:hypothetical protein
MVSENKKQMMIRLLDPRIAVGLKYPKRYFLEALSYPLIREIEGLGWLVSTGPNPREPQLTIIPFYKGEVVHV